MMLLYHLRMITTSVFADEIEQQDKGALSSRETNFPSSIDSCKVVGNDLYIHHYLIMDMSRPRNSQIRASKEVFIKDGMLKYNKCLQEKQEANKKSFGELLEKEKQKRHKAIVTFQNKYFSINRITSLLQEIVYHYAEYIKNDINYMSSTPMLREVRMGGWGSHKVQKLIISIENLLNYVVSFNEKLYKLEA